MAITVEQRNELIKLYQATFDRAADADGLSFWANELDKGASLLDVARSLFVSQEGRDLYPSSLATGELVDRVYDNLLDREPEVEGKQFWVEQLDTGSVSRATFVQAVIDGAEDNLTPQGQADAELIQKKTEVSEAFVDEGLNDVAQAREVIEQVEGPRGNDPDDPADDGRSVEEVIAEFIKTDDGQQQILDLNEDLQNDDGIVVGTDGTAEQVRYEYDSAQGGQFTIEGFGTGEDTLVFDLPGTDPAPEADTLDAINGFDLGGGNRVSVQVDQINGDTLVALGLDEAGNAISIELRGVADPSQVDLTVA